MTLSGGEPSIGLQGENLIFLISQPRSGSSLLQRILSGHPEIYSTAEPWLMLHPIYALRNKGIKAEYDEGQARLALEDFCQNLPGGEEDYIEGIRKMASHLYSQAMVGSGKKYFLDKTPRYYHVIPELRRIFPKAKFIFLVRNPLAVLNSILKTWVGKNTDRLALFKSDLLSAPGSIAEGVQALGKQASVVPYEKLVCSPEETVSHLAETLGIEFVPEMLEYGNHPVPEGRMGDPVRVHLHSSPVSDYSDTWVGKLVGSGGKDLALAYLSHLGPALLEDLGYPQSDLLEQLESVSKVEEGASPEGKGEYFRILGFPRKETVGGR